MFPTANSQVYRNEAGEVLGWDNPGYDDGPDPDEYYEQFGQYDDEGDDLDDDPGYNADDFELVDIEPVDEQYGDDGDLRDHYGDPDERDEDPPEPREPDDDEVSWQEYGRGEGYDVVRVYENDYGE